MNTPSDRHPSRPKQPLLFETPADEPTPPAEPPALYGRPRLRTANRDQIVFRAAPLDELIPPDHPARVVWDYVDGLDLSPLYNRIKSVEGSPGRPPIDPKILWRSGSTPPSKVSAAPATRRTLPRPRAFQWIAATSVSNYHTFADFRTDHGELLDDLLTQSVAALVAEGLVDLNRVAQDGMRVRASAGAASFAAGRPWRRPSPRPRRRSRRCGRRWKRTRQPRSPAEEGPGTCGPGACRADKGGIGRLPELEAKKKPGEERRRGARRPTRRHGDEDGRRRFRPAYNVQFSTATGSQVIVGVEVETTGSDAGQMAPMVEQVTGGTRRRRGRSWSTAASPSTTRSRRSAPRIWVARCMPRCPAQGPAGGPARTKPGDSAAVAEWRARMGTKRPRRSTRNEPRRPNASIRRRGTGVATSCWSVAWPRSRRSPCGTHWLTT